MLDQQKLDQELVLARVLGAGAGEGCLAGVRELERVLHQVPGAPPSGKGIKSGPERFLKLNISSNARLERTIPNKQLMKTC